MLRAAKTFLVLQVLHCALLLLLVVPEVVHGFGNEEDILIQSFGKESLDTTPSEETTLWYSCTFRSLWTAQRHPVNYPTDAAWKGPIAWTHNLEFAPWTRGNTASSGIEQFVETGNTATLKDEIFAAGDQVHESVEYPDASFKVQEKYFVHLPPLQATPDHAYMTFMAAMSPSPDWFTGFHSYWMVDAYTRTWHNHFKIQTWPWDAGTDAGTTYTAPDSHQDPPEPVNFFSERNAPEGGELLASQALAAEAPFPNVGEVECLLTVGPEPLILPEECDWMANPCCNETDTTASTCFKTLPNGDVPEISPQLQQVLDSRTKVRVPCMFHFSFFPDTPVQKLEQGFLLGFMQQIRLFYIEVLTNEYAEVDGIQLQTVDAVLVGDAIVDQAYRVDFDAIAVFEDNGNNNQPKTKQNGNKQPIPTADQVYAIMENADYQRFLEVYVWEAGGVFWNFNGVVLSRRDNSSPFECPEPAREIACTADYNPVTCGPGDCEYSNTCVANAAGFDKCTPANPTPTQSPTSRGNVGGGGGDDTVLGVIQSNPELTSFAIALQQSGLDSVLSQSNKQFTVFAPSNTAMANDQVFDAYMHVDDWLHHLRSNIQLMVVPNQALTNADIFDGVKTELPSLNGTLFISQPFSAVNLASIQQSSQAGSNGIVHIMDAVIKNSWREYTLRDVNQFDELVEGVSPILDRINFDDPLTEFVHSGTSFIAARDRAYGDDSIALGFNDIVVELQDPNNADLQNETFMYNLIDMNLYEQDIERGTQLLIMPRSGSAHMWITKDTEKGILRFNDAELSRQALANNGVMQIVNKPVIPPGLAMIMQYCADYTTINLKEMAQYFKSSKWNLRDLTKSIGTQQGSFNVFAPLQDGYGEFSAEVAVRLSTLEWERHLWNFLLHMTVEPAYTTEELYRIAEDAGGAVEMKMLSGFTTVLALDDDGELTIDSARLLQPLDMKGVDGYIHLVEQVPLPPSVLYTVYDQTQQNPNMTTVTRLIDTVQLGVFIDNLLPVTFFSAVNSAWENITIPKLEIEDVLKNMIFEFLWYDDYLAKMGGQQITSVNGKTWDIQVFDDWYGERLVYDPVLNPVRIYFSNTEGPEGLTNCTLIPGRNRTNILAKTGIIHHIDCLFLDHDYSSTKEDESCGECPCDQFFSENAAACVELNCFNWQRGTPRDEDPYSEVPCQVGHQFCGRDGECHPYSCETWYEFGPGLSTADLVCEDYDTGSDDNANSVIYGCRSYLPGKKAPSAKSAVHYFNQECKATGEGYEFRCYQNKMGTDYNDFSERVEQMPEDSCPSNIHEFDQPQFWYTVVMEQHDLDGQVTTMRRTHSGASFDLNNASLTMHAVDVWIPVSDSDDLCVNQKNLVRRCVQQAQCSEPCGDLSALRDNTVFLNLDGLIFDGFLSELSTSTPDEVSKEVEALWKNSCRNARETSCRLSDCCEDCAPQISIVMDCFSQEAESMLQRELAALGMDLDIPFSCNVSDHVCQASQSPSMLPSVGAPSMSPSVVATPANTAVVLVDAAFELFNTLGLKAEDLLLPENKDILVQALADFITALISEVQSQSNQQQQARFLRLHSARSLAVVLLEGSSRIVNVEDVPCRSDANIPENATCQNVFGEYDLQIDEDEDKETVYNTYARATDNAIQDGKLQASLAAVAPPTTPLFVAGPVARTNNTSTSTSAPVNDTEEGDKGGMAWWVILLFCLAAICGCGALGLAGVYVREQQQQQSDQDAASAEGGGNNGESGKPGPEGEMAPLEGADGETNEDAQGSSSDYNDDSWEDGDSDVAKEEAAPLVASSNNDPLQQSTGVYNASNGAGAYPANNDQYRQDPSRGDEAVSPLVAMHPPQDFQQTDSDADESWES